MPLYAAVYVPFVTPGQQFVCFDGTETPGAAVKSAAFMRGRGPLGLGGPVTFTIDFATSPTAVVLIQASNQNVEADFQTIWTSTDKQHDNITDAPETAFRFYRAVLSTYSAGGMPVVIAQR